jgi:hypothetical protein
MGAVGTQICEYLVIIEKNEVSRYLIICPKIIFVYHSNLFLCMRVFRPSCRNAMFITEMYTSGKSRNNLRVQFAELRHT